jgi:molybdopterin synthase sulfur carrier subunit
LPDPAPSHSRPTTEVDAANIRTTRWVVTGGPSARGDPVPVPVNLPTVLRSHAGGAKTVSAEGSTIGEVLSALAEEYPGLSGQVINGDGTLHKFVNVYLNDDDVRYLSSLDTPVKDSDEISILPAVAGGAVGSAVLRPR